MFTLRAINHDQLALGPLRQVSHTILRANFFLAFWLVRIVRGFHVNGDTGALRATSRTPLPFKRTCHFNIITLVIANHSFNRGGFA